MRDTSDERYEQLLAYIATHLPSPFVQEEFADTVVFTGGDPGEVVVQLTDTSVTVSEYAVRRDAGTAVIRPRRVGTLRWRRLSSTALMRIVGDLIKGAREHRLARYRTCASCGARKPPEWMRTARLCHDCAARQARAVH